MKWFLIAFMLHGDPDQSSLSKAVYGGRDAHLIGAERIFDTEAECLAEAQKGGPFHASGGEQRDIAVVCVPGYVSHR